MDLPRSAKLASMQGVRRSRGSTPGARVSARSARVRRTFFALFGLCVAGCLLPEVTFEPVAGVGGSEAGEAGSGGDTAIGGTGGDPGAGGTAAPAACALPPCATGEACVVAEDCASLVCAAVGCTPELALCCQAPTCADGIANGDEPVPDCGSVTCGPCPLDAACIENAHCDSGSCLNGVCAAPSCTDLALNGTETAIDCGGSNAACARCAAGVACIVGTDCASGICEDSLCISCGDTLLNGTETDVDCGGDAAACARCAPGRICLVDADCTSGACAGGRCCGGTGADCTRCAERLSPVNDCADENFVAEECAEWIACLAANPVACPTVDTANCSQSGDVCDRNDFGGNGNPAIQRGLAILTEAGCGPLPDDD
jgi:hypothetical protein